MSSEAGRLRNVAIVKDDKRALASKLQRKRFILPAPAHASAAPPNGLGLRRPVSWRAARTEK
jgi:hypothetical protein